MALLGPSPDETKKTWIQHQLGSSHIWDGFSARSAWELLIQSWRRQVSTCSHIWLNYKCHLFCHDFTALKQKNKTEILCIISIIPVICFFLFGLRYSQIGALCPKSQGLIGFSKRSLSKVVPVRWPSAIWLDKNHWLIYNYIVKRPWFVN